MILKRLQDGQSSRKQNSKAGEARESRDKREGKGITAMRGRGDVVADGDAGNARARQMAMQGQSERHGDEIQADGATRRGEMR